MNFLIKIDLKRNDLSSWKLRFRVQFRFVLLDFLFDYKLPVFHEKNYFRSRQFTEKALGANDHSDIALITEKWIVFGKVWGLFQ